MWLQRQGLAVCRDCFIQLPHLFEHETEIAVGIGIVGPQSNCLSDQIHGDIIASHLMGNHTEIVKRIDVRWLLR